MLKAARITRLAFMNGPLIDMPRTFFTFQSFSHHRFERMPAAIFSLQTNFTSHLLHRPRRLHPLLPADHVRHPKGQPQFHLCPRGRRAGPEERDYKLSGLSGPVSYFIS